MPKECRLDFKSFNKILFQWINQLKNDIQTNDKENTIDTNKTNSASKPLIRRRSNNSYLCSKKLQHLRYSTSCNFNFLHESRQISEERDYCSLIEHNNANGSNYNARSYSRSLSLSEDELDSNINEFDLKNEESSEITAKNDLKQQEIYELKSENHQLKQTIFDLKSQIQNAEETNSQLSSDFEQQIIRTNDLFKQNQDLNLNFALTINENEQFRKMIEQLRIKECCLLNENTELNIHLREKENLVNQNENQINLINSKCRSAEFEIEELTNEMKSEKVFFFFFNQFFAI